MADIWNKYANTAARKHGKPGRDVRPKSVTIDAHSAYRGAARGRIHQAASRCQSTIPLAHFASAETKALNAKQEADIRGCMTGYDERFAIMDKMGVDMQLVMPPPPQCYHTVALEYAVPAAQMINDGVAEFVSKHTDRFIPTGTVPMQDGNEAAKELERCMKQAQVQGRRDPHQCCRQGIVRSGLRAVLEKGRRAGRAGDHPPERIHRRPPPVALLLQQRDRQSVRDHARPALSDLRRRARAPSEAEGLCHARRRLPWRLFRPHRPRLGRALGLPRRPAEAADQLPEAGLCRHGRLHRRAAEGAGRYCSASITSSWAPTIRSTCWSTIRSATSPRSTASTRRPAPRLPAATRKKLLGTIAPDGPRRRENPTLRSRRSQPHRCCAARRALALPACGSPANRRRDGGRAR